MASLPSVDLVPDEENTETLALLNGRHRRRKAAKRRQGQYTKESFTWCDDIQPTLFLYYL
jgi:hypothetical protein